MEPERPHRTSSINSTSSSSATTSAASELFICFTSRLPSSSSMKIPSKSILSPGRARDSSQISLSTSLSRRLRSNGSMRRGQASPMFGSSGRKRGSGAGFENPEPSSPKVTCIGQVRVKTRKQGKRFRSAAARSKRRSEMSFRNLDQRKSGGYNVVEMGENRDLGLSGHRNNQRWVHFPVTICEALRAFSSEFNCFLPCRSSCTDGNKEDKMAGNNNHKRAGDRSSCGDVFARWLVSVQDGEGKGREIELVVGGDGGGEEEEEWRRSRRRHVFEDLDFGDGCKGEKAFEEEGGGEARVGACVPPKNALLLMRCRSDPVKMAALANRFWEPPEPHDEEEEYGEVEPEAKEEQKLGLCEKKPGFLDERRNLEAESSFTQTNEEERYEMSPDLNEEQETFEAENHGHRAENERRTLEEAELNIVYEPEVSEDPDCEEEILAKFIQAIDDDIKKELQTSEAEQDSVDATGYRLQSQKPEPEENPMDTQGLGALFSEEKGEEEEEKRIIHERREPENPVMAEPEPDPEPKFREEEQSSVPEVKTKARQALPDCLLLMMCEPKLSMEVSKETWVCSTDFIRRLPERPALHKPSAGDEAKKRKGNKTESNAPPKQSNARSKPRGAVNPVLLQPPRSSCSFPVAPPLAAAASQKLVGGQIHAPPLVLTRCKSEPMRSSARLMPEPCFWKNRKLEPHRPATVGIGAAGVGF